MSRRSRRWRRRALAGGAAAVGLTAALGGARWAWTHLPVQGPAFPADCPHFAEGDPWNQDVRGLPVHPMSETWLAAMGGGGLDPDFGPDRGIPLTGIGPGQDPVPVRFVYRFNSDPGPYRVPLDAAVQRGERRGDWNPYPDGDRRVIAVDAGACEVFELFGARAEGGGWRAISGSHYSLEGPSPPPLGWRSTPTAISGLPTEVHDPSGLPVFPGLVYYGELESGRIEHALRVTAPGLQRAYIPPARYAASTLRDPDLPPVGLRLRLRAGYTCAGPEPAQVLCEAMKTYGLILAGQGPPWQLTGVPDARWSEAVLEAIRAVPAAAFEAVQTGEIVPY